MRGTQNWTYLIFFSLACGPQQYIAPQPKAELRTEKGENETTVCDPFSGGSKSGIRNGIEGRLHYLPSSIKFLESKTNIMSLNLNHFNPDSSPLAQELVSPSTRLIFSRLNAPTQAFELGFRDASGTPLKDKSGNTLIEFFSLHLKTRLSAPSDGRYQLAVMSDDGAIVSAIIDGQQTRILSNDFVHSNRIQCSPNEGLSLKKDHPIALEILYFQGPRTFINLCLFWRKAEAQNTTDMECQPPATSSQQAVDTDRANDYFYKNGNPTSSMQQFLARGWQVIPAEYFWLEGSSTNPCIK